MRHARERAHTEWEFSGNGLLQEALVIQKRPPRNVVCIGPCRNSDAVFTFVVNFMVPGPPFRNLVMSWSHDQLPPGWSASASDTSGWHLSAGRMRGNIMPTLVTWDCRSEPQQQP